MGEHADDLIDQMIDGISDDDQTDANEWWDTVGRFNRTCHCCGAANLAWEDVSGKWRLFGGDGKIHVCAVRPLNPVYTKACAASGSLSR